VGPEQLFYPPWGEKGGEREEGRERGGEGPRHSGLGGTGMYRVAVVVHWLVQTIQITMKTLQNIQNEAEYSK